MKKFPVSIVKVRRGFWLEWKWRKHVKFPRWRFTKSFAHIIGIKIDLFYALGELLASRHEGKLEKSCRSHGVVVLMSHIASQSINLWLHETANLIATWNRWLSWELLHPLACDTHLRSVGDDESQLGSILVSTLERKFALESRAKLIM